jgi:cell fate regulator YaaT (PSP1 superfamily)
VRFKRTTSTFRLLPTCQHIISIGDYVKVEADRGHDIGVVCGVLPPNTVDNTPINNNENNARYIIDIATNEEKIFLLAKLKDESRALTICREMSAHRNMHIQLLDAEFQFDRNKITFVFTSNR